MNTFAHRALSFSAAIAAITASASVAMAQHAGDFILSVDDNRVLTSTVEPGNVLVPYRVFFGGFGTGVFQGRSSNPGFNALAGGMPPGRTIGITLLAAIREWRDASFCTIPDEFIKVRETPFEIVTPSTDPAPADPLASLEVAIAELDGALHEHPAWFLLKPDPVNPGSFVVGDSGVYLLELRFYSQSPDNTSPAPSLPAWIIFNQSRPAQEVQDATAWVLANKVGGVTNPCCRADFNASGAVSVQDIFDFLAAWFAGSPTADFNNSSAITVQDIFDFLAAWFSGC